MAEPLVEALIAEQERRGWSGAEMARQLGVSKSAWHYHRHEICRPGRRFIEAALARFPKLRPVVGRSFVKVNGSVQ